MENVVRGAAFFKSANIKLFAAVKMRYDAVDV